MKTTALAALAILGALVLAAPTSRVALRGFTRVHLKPGEQRTVRFTLGDRDLSHVSPDGVHLVSAGRYGLSVGGGQPDTRAAVVTGTLEIRGGRTLPR